MQNQAYEVFLALLRRAVNGEKLNQSVKAKLSEKIPESLFRLADFHDLAHVVSNVLYKEKLCVPEQFIKKENLAKYRYGVLDYETERLKNAFEEEKIPYILLKGCTLRELYPEPYLRASCDIDVLVKDEDVKRATDVIIKRLGAESGEEEQHDIAFVTDSNVSIELHFNFGDKFGAEELLSDTWKTAKLVDGRYGYQMEEGVLNAYLIFHAANHFKSGGCGVKTFIDFHLLAKKKGFSAKTGRNYLEKLRLEKFAQNVYALANAWFNGGEYSETLIVTEDFVLKGGVYGTLKQKTEVEVVKEDKKYYWFRIFPRFKEMKLRYKKLEKYPILLPFYYVKRWFSLLSKKKREDVKAEINYKNNAQAQLLEKTEKMLQDLGL